MKFLLVFAALLSARLMGAPALTTAGAYELNKRSSVDRKYASGTKLFDAQQFGTMGTWDATVASQAIAGTDVPLLDQEGLPIMLPAGAIIRDCLIQVATPASGATGSLSLAFSSKAVGDLKTVAFASTAYNSKTTPIACTPIGTVGTMIRTTSELTLKVRIGSEAPAAGKINVWIEYVLSDATS